MGPQHRKSAFHHAGIAAGCPVIRRLRCFLRRVRVVGDGAAAELLKRAGFGGLKELQEYPTPRLEDALTILTRSVEEREAAQRMLEEQREQAAAEQQRRLEAAVAKTTEHKEKVDFEARAAAMAAKGRGAA